VHRWTDGRLPGAPAVHLLERDLEAVYDVFAAALARRAASAHAAAEEIEDVRHATAPAATAAHLLHRLFAVLRCEAHTVGEAGSYQMGTLPVLWLAAAEIAAALHHFVSRNS
jgi:hypothetical protein